MIQILLFGVRRAVFDIELKSSFAVSPNVDAFIGAVVCILGFEVFTDADSFGQRFSRSH